MKINRFILRDEADTQFDDLITFENDVLLEDIYTALTQLGKFTIEFIGQLEIIEY